MFPESQKASCLAPLENHRTVSCSSKCCVFGAIEHLCKYALLWKGVWSACSWYFFAIRLQCRAFLASSLWCVTFLSQLSDPSRRRSVGAPRTHRQIFRRVFCWWRPVEAHMSCGVGQEGSFRARSLFFSWTSSSEGPRQLPWIWWEQFLSHLFHKN